MNTPDRTKWGLPIRDADEKLILQVVRGDVTIAVAGDCHACVFAVCSVRRRDVLAASFGNQFAYIQFRGEEFVRRYELSKPAREALRHYDESSVAGVPWFQTGRYTLLPPAASRKIGYRVGKKGTSVRGTGAVVRKHTTRSRKDLVR